LFVGWQARHTVACKKNISINPSVLWLGERKGIIPLKKLTATPLWDNWLNVVILKLKILGYRYWQCIMCNCFVYTRAYYSIDECAI